MKLMSLDRFMSELDEDQRLFMARGTICVRIDQVPNTDILKLLEGQVDSIAQVIYGVLPDFKHDAGHVHYAARLRVRIADHVTEEERSELIDFFKNSRTITGAVLSDPFQTVTVGIVLYDDCDEFDDRHLMETLRAQALNRPYYEDN